MSIGYACLQIGVPNTSLKSCTLKNATEDRLLELITHNLNALENMMEYNIRQGIYLFRISSDIIPFGSNAINTLPWWDIFKEQFSRIGNTIRAHKVRVSMHPGQYTVLNSPHNDVVVRAIEDLNYHNRVLDCLGVGQEHKLVLHIGGIYGDKKEAMNRFIKNYSQLSEGVKKRLVIENDDKSYTIEDVLAISDCLGIPVIFDNLHHAINPSQNVASDRHWIETCGLTWKREDGVQKIHYSQQDTLKKRGSHSQTIYSDEFMTFYNEVGGKAIDIMLEVKDKNLSAIKCINATGPQKTIKDLEIEWRKYKYTVLEKSHTHYNAIRKLLKDKNDYPVKTFYQFLETALLCEPSIGSCRNAMMHVWGYFKDVASIKEKETFFRYLENFENKNEPPSRIKNFLFKLAIKYERQYLLDSYYFFI